MDRGNSNTVQGHPFFKSTDQTWGINFWRIIRRLTSRDIGRRYPAFQLCASFHCRHGRRHRRYTTGFEYSSEAYVLGSVSQSGTPGLPSTQKAAAGIDVNLGFGAGTRSTPRSTPISRRLKPTSSKWIPTRFSLLFPEKREFFLENSGIFGFGELGQITSNGGSGIGTPGRLSGGGNDLLFFFSRRIGISDDGHAIPVLGGGRLTGTHRRVVSGFLNISTRASGPTSATNFTVARVKRNILFRLLDSAPSSSTRMRGTPIATTEVMAPMPTCASADRRR